MRNFTFMDEREKSLLFLICAITFLFTVTLHASDANNEEAAKAAPRRINSSQPYCGLYCVYTILELTDQKVDFKELIKPEYLGSSKGSSMAELKDAAEDYGLHVVPAENLSSRELRNSPYPVILHVKSDMKNQEYDHYELFLGTENGKAKLFNPPESIELVPYSEITPRWDGYGLIVSTEQIDLSSFFAPTRKRLILYSAFAILIILFIHWAKRFLPVGLFQSRIKFMGMSVAQAAGFALAAILVGMFYHFANDAGFLARVNATASIQKAHQGNFIPKINEKEVKQLLNTDTVFIDARLARDYESEHLESAISVPVDSNDVERHEATADIEKNARIVMYCQSSGCQYAEIVAIKLKEDGFTNISIYKGGWADWKQKKALRNNLWVTR